MADQPKGRGGSHGGERHGGDECDGGRRPKRGKGSPPAARIEVLNPANGEGSLDRVDGPESIAATVARVRANQAEWETIGVEGRYHWLGKLRDWILDHVEVFDTVQAETGKVRGDIAAELFYVTDLINFYGTNAAKFIGDEAVRPHSPLIASKN